MDLNWHGCERCASTVLTQQARSDGSYVVVVSYNP